MSRLRALLVTLAVLATVLFATNASAVIGSIAETRVGNFQKPGGLSLRRPWLLDAEKHQEKSAAFTTNASRRTVVGNGPLDHWDPYGLDGVPYNMSFADAMRQRTRDGFQTGLENASVWHEFQRRAESAQGKWYEVVTPDVERSRERAARDAATFLAENLQSEPTDEAALGGYNTAMIVSQEPHAGVAGGGLPKAGLNVLAKTATQLGYSPTVAALRAIGPVKGFQAHHLLPEYLGKMMGFTRAQMRGHPGTLISQWAHTGKLNPAAVHKAISKYLPPMVNGQRATYTSAQIRTGLERAYGDLGRRDLWDAIAHLF